MISGTLSSRTLCYCDEHSPGSAIIGGKCVEAKHTRNLHTTAAFDIDLASGTDELVNVDTVFLFETDAASMKPVFAATIACDHPTFSTFPADAIWYIDSRGLFAITCHLIQDLLRLEICVSEHLVLKAFVFHFCVSGICVFRSFVLKPFVPDFLALQFFVFRLIVEFVGLKFNILEVLFMSIAC